MSAAAPTASNPITTPYTVDQLQALASSEAASAISAENAPLTAQIGTLGGQKTAAEQEINQMYGQLLPYVQQSAQAVQSAQQQAETMAQQVFAAAGTRMNQLYQQQASEAQQLAQQMGGPVSAGQFTAGVEPYMAALPGEQGAGVLGALGSGLANTTEAQQFAGQVFPALNTEDVAKSDSYYNNQMKTLNDQIAANAATKSDLVGKNFNDLLQNERQFTQQQLQLKMDQTKMKRDWQIQQEQLHSAKLRDALAKQAAKQAGVRLGQEQQRINIASSQGQQRLAIERTRAAIQEQSVQARIQHANQTAKAGQARMSLSATKDARTVLEAAMGGGKPISMTSRDYIPDSKGKIPPVGVSGAYYDPQKNSWYKIQHETKPPAGGTPIIDPNRLFQIVRGSSPELGRKATINLIRAQVPGAKNWTPGQKVHYTGKELHGLGIGELTDIAQGRGYKGKTGAKNRQAMTDFILGISPAPYLPSPLMPNLFSPTPTSNQGNNIFNP
jgi:hypothetical protein